MKKRLRFIYRYITTSKRWHSWINAQVVWVFIISCIFLSVLAWSAPFSVDNQHREIASRRPLSAVGAVAISRESSKADYAAISMVDGAVQQQATPTQPAGARPTATPFPPEFAYNSQQTIGLTLTATVLVLIVVFGVLIFMPKKSE